MSVLPACMYMHHVQPRCLQRLESSRFLGIGVTDFCEQPIIWSLGTDPWSYAGTISSLSHCAISPALYLYLSKHSVGMSVFEYVKKCDEIISGGVILVIYF